VVVGLPADLTVIAPCLNEELNIPELVRRTLAVFERGELNGELILVDDGSTDATRDVIARLATEHPGRVVGRFHERNLGITAAWRTGVDAAHGAKVAIIDADLQYQPEDLLRLYRAIDEYHIDVVQGWRSPVGRERGTRYNVSRIFNTMLNLAFRMKLRDNKSGFVLCAKEVMDDLLTYRGRYWYWQSFIMVAAHAKGYSYREIETLFENRRAGTSFLTGNTALVSAKATVDLATAFWEYRLRPPSGGKPEHFLRRYPVEDRNPESQASSTLLWRGYMAFFHRTHWMITRDVEDFYESLRRTQWLPAAQMRELQDEKLRRLVRHAYRNVPYYRARMRELRLLPNDIRGVADIHKLPMLTKQNVRDHRYFDILSENHVKDEVLKITTSGSTGEPFVCYADRRQLEFRWAATLRSQEWTGYRFGDPCVRLWHQTIGMSTSQAWRERLDAAMLRRKFIAVFELRDAALARTVDEIRAVRPTLIDGYAEALDLIAAYLRTHQGAGFGAKGVVSSAQMLPPASRALIEESFGCPVFDKYGAREFSGVAYECEAHDGHHVVSEGFVVEVLRDGQPARPGETGEVVVTDLNNYCLPFIRYRIGDLAVAMDDTPCACGRGLSRIGAIEGRVQSIIQGTDGRFLPGSFFAHYLKDYDHAIRQFQVVQEEQGALRFVIVKAGRYSDDVLAEILATFRQYLGQDMKIAVESTDDIKLVHTGKRLAAMSKLNIDFQRQAPQRVIR
jgi:phenylacetate-CoA ligase